MKLFVTINNDARLLGHFLRHYSGFGITEFFIAVGPCPPALPIYQANDCAPPDRYRAASADVPVLVARASHRNAISGPARHRFVVLIAPNEAGGRLRSSIDSLRSAGSCKDVIS